jgi:hypothetical protein
MLLGLNGNLYRVFTAFVPTFTDFSPVYRLLQTFIEFFDFKNVFGIVQIY